MSLDALARINLRVALGLARAEANARRLGRGDEYRQGLAYGLLAATETMLNGEPPELLAVKNEREFLTYRYGRD